jgi:hypothetical protein
MANLFNLFGKKSPGDQTEDILARHLNGDFRVFPMAEGRISASQAAAVSKRLGVQFPPDLVAHLCGRFPGVQVEAKEEVWPRPRKFDVGPFWTFLYAIRTYSAADTSEDWMRLEVVGSKFKQDTGLPVIPILQRVGDANCYCVGLHGELFEFDHETRALAPVEGTFFQLFEREIHGLTERTAKRKSLASRS